MMNNIVVEDVNEKHINHLVGHSTLTIRSPIHPQPLGLNLFIDFLVLTFRFDYLALTSQC